MYIPKQFFAIAGAASTDVTRANLCGVNVQRKEDGSCSLCATDGRILVTADFNDETARNEMPIIDGFDPAPLSGFNAIVPSSAWDALSKAIPKKASLPVLLHGGVSEPDGEQDRELKLAASSLDRQTVLRSKEIPGRFPDPKSMIRGLTPVTRDDLKAPTDIADPCAEIYLNANLLKEALTIVDKMIHDSSRHGKPVIRLRVPLDPSVPILITSATHDHLGDVNAIVMPCRPDSKLVLKLKAADMKGDQHE